jgi:hypothetical protein
MGVLLKAGTSGSPVTPGFSVGVLVVNLFNFLCSPIMCLSCVL